MESVSSVLLFNSKETPYFNYTSQIDNFSAQDDIRERNGRESSADENLLAEMPESMLKGDQLPSFQSLNYDYKPQMKSTDTWEGSATNLAFGTNLPAVADLSYDVGGSGTNTNTHT